MIATRVGFSRQVICASPSYLKARGTPKTPQELSAHDCITFEGVASPKSWNFTAGKKTISVPIRSRLIVTTAEAAIDAAVAALGITRVLWYQVADLPEDKIVTILKEFESTPIPVSLIHLGGTILPQKLRAFLDFVTPRLKARLSQGA